MGMLLLISRSLEPRGAGRSPREPYKEDHHAYRFRGAGRRTSDFQQRFRRRGGRADQGNRPRQFDDHAHDGKSYKLPGEFDVDELKEGMDILLAYDKVGGENLITDMELPE
jgi:hypothetical protein